MTFTANKTNDGFTLVEVLIAIAMMGGLVLMISTLLIKSITMSYSMDVRYAEAIQVHSLILDIQKDLYRSAYISNNSHQNRLEYTTYDDAGNTIKKFTVFVIPPSMPQAQIQAVPFLLQVIQSHTLSFLRMVV
jgi:prepilin-type N-terminal cleavage/methylation domain-containing protein